MCLYIYIGSDKKLPIIPWSNETPGFCVDETSVEELPAIVKSVLVANHYYEVGSFMGCGCGFSFGQWSKESNDNHEQRIRNVQDLNLYLDTHLENNTIKLFCTSWDFFPDSYPEKFFSISKKTSGEFRFAEDVVLQICR